jgi:hypothetical protein
MYSRVCYAVTLSAVDLQLEYVFEKKTYKRESIYVVLPLQSRIVEKRSDGVVYADMSTRGQRAGQRVVKSRVI